MTLWQDPTSWYCNLCGQEGWDANGTLLEHQYMTDCMYYLDPWDRLPVEPDADIAHWM